MANIKNLVFFKANKIVHLAYTMNMDSLKICKISTNIAQNGFKDDFTTEYGLLEPTVSVIETSAFENCKELQIYK